jgi:hypothetical protein
MEAVGNSETSVNFYQSKRCNVPEDGHLQISRRLPFDSDLIKSYPIYAIDMWLRKIQINILSSSLHIGF